MNAVGKSGNSEVKLSISIFSGTFKKSDVSKKIPEEDLMVFSCKSFSDKSDLINCLNSLVNGTIEGLTLNHFAKSENLLEANTLDAINWMKDRMMMNVALEDTSDTAPPVKGKIHFFDTRENVKHIKPFSLEKGKCIAALYKSREKLLVMALQLKDIQEKYATEFRGEKFTIYSADSSWSDTQLEKDSITFHKAKAVIPSEKGEFVLKGETIIYTKEDECLLAEKASLTKPDGTMYTTLGKIKIHPAHPLNYKIY
ncbi:MAG: hypothetical protein JSV88_24815 [Candidatus Aminicenantes bacterium]|nr:MAG: hypothetical protein JSV88_24815 [Candidatus Aminicenantes bacterium]